MASATSSCAKDTTMAARDQNTLDGDQASHQSTLERKLELLDLGNMSVCLYKRSASYPALYTSADIFFVKQPHALRSEDQKKDDQKMESSTLLAISHAPATRDLETLIRDVLPFEIKLAVLKEYLRHWTSIGNASYLPTSRAALTQLSTLEDGSLLKKSANTWYMRPKYLDHFRHLQCHQRAQSTTSNNFSISKILLPFASSKEFFQPLRGFLFSHITWIFSRKEQLYHVVEGQALRLPQSVLRSIKHICLELGYAFDFRHERVWGWFVKLFEYTIKVLSSNLLPGTTTFEISGRHFDAKVKNNWTYRVISHEIRTKYLVTRCFQLVKLRPDIKIVISGVSLNSLTKLDPADYPRIGSHRQTTEGLGFSENKVEDFLRTRHEIQLPSLELPGEVRDMRTTADVGKNFFDPEGIEALRKTIHFKHCIHWKVLFVEEWEKIWELGLKDPEDEDSKGYDGVHDVSLTMDIWDSDDDDTSSESENEESDSSDEENEN